MIRIVISKTPEVILALDVDNRQEAQKILHATGEKLKWVKVGLQSYLRDGPDLVHTIADSGKKVFLDLKLHDIPNTMAKAMESLATLPIGMLTLHANAGEEALLLCSDIGKSFLPDTLLLAVTVLTSMDQRALQSIGVKSSVIEQVERLAILSVKSQMGGIVCSPQELIHLRAKLPNDTRLITPGIRPTGSAIGDQKRITTPSLARDAGADYLVIGRPILAANDPAQALENILGEIRN
jgi:orotidine-5'-phosphate decarboxylase